jgi:hypothetical protein
MAVMDLPHTMSVERLSTASAAKEGYTPRDDVACFLQPAGDAETDTGQAQAFTKPNRCFVDFAANVKVKDRVTISGQRYNVSGMIEHAYGVWPHKVLTLQTI